MKKLAKDLVAGDEIIWPLHPECATRHRSGKVIRVELPTPPCVVAKVVCEAEWFRAGIHAEYDVVPVEVFPHE